MAAESTFFFVGRLSNRYEKYQVQEEKLAGGLHLEVIADGIGIWCVTDKKYDELITIVSDALNILLAAFVFKTNSPMSHSVDCWVEAQDVKSTKNIIGWVMPPHLDLALPDRDASINDPWKQAALFYRESEGGTGNINHRLALIDYRAALQDTSDNAFFFAYRAIEDICRAVTGKDTDDAAAWKEMHNELGTNKAKLKPLIDVSTPIRHGKSDDTVKAARGKRSELLDIAYDVIKREFGRTFPTF